VNDELLVRDRVEIERRRDEATRLDRINGVERDLAVLRTRFDAAFDGFLKELARAVDEDDLKSLKREWETALRDAISGIREHFATANDQQSSALLGQVELMLARDRQAAESEAKKTRTQLNFVILGAVLSILGGFFLFYETAKLH
jgi:hypothetical protein